MNRSAEEFVQGLQCVGNAICIGRVNTSLAMNVLKCFKIVGVYGCVADLVGRSPVSVIV